MTMKRSRSTLIEIQDERCSHRSQGAEDLVAVCLSLRPNLNKIGNVKNVCSFFHLMDLSISEVDTIASGQSTKFLSAVTVPQLGVSAYLAQSIDQPNC